MNVVVWLAEGTWEAAVDAARRAAPPDARVTLLHVADAAVARDVHAAWAGLVGRGGRAPDPGGAVAAAADRAQAALLAAAARRFGRPATRATRQGRPEREVVAASAGADLLVVARDGEPDRVGPRSLGPRTRFVVDHAPCAVLLVWPGEPPPAQLPPPPPH
jgi:nucleotide-binding universal stress UspA family protein